MANRINIINKHYLQIVNFFLLSGKSYIQLPKELRNSSKGLINIKNKDNECFRWCRIRYLSQQEVHPERIKKFDKEYINKLDYSNIAFPVKSMITIR